MFKKILVFLLVLAAIFSLMSVPICYAASEGAEYAFHVKGGVVKSGGSEGLNELLAAFTDTDGNAYAQKVEGKENAIELMESVVLDAPIKILNGSYKIYGRYLSVYRGFEDSDPMFLIAGVGENAASLTFEDSGTGEWTTPSLTVDGNSSQFPNSQTGMIMLKGRASLTVNKGVLMTNSSTSAYGGAIYAELNEEGTDRSPTGPKIVLDNCMFTNCSAHLGGGAVAMLAYYSGTNDGSLEIKNSVFKSNTSDSTEVNGNGGAIYAVGGTVTLDNVQLLENKAHNGGAIYTAADTKLTGCTVQYNTALLSGGAIYCGSYESAGGSVEVAESEVSHNTSNGVGGAFTNKSYFLLSGLTLITSNESVGNGAGVYNEGTFTMQGGSLMSNKSGALGGGIYSVGVNSKIKQESGEINNNDALLCSGVYCEGSYELLGGAIGNNKGEAPQILVKGNVTMGGTGFVQGNTLGLCVTENDGIKHYPCIELKSKLTTTVLQEVSYYKEKLDSDGNVKGYKKATRSGELLYFGSEASTEGADEIFNVTSRGLLSYKLDGGVTEVRFVFLPILAWLLILLGILCAACFVFRKKLLVFLKFLRKKLKKKKKPVVYNGGNKRKRKRKK